jgi:hypothetical protein
MTSFSYLLKEARLSGIFKKFDSLERPFLLDRFRVLIILWRGPWFGDLLLLRLLRTELLRGVLRLLRTELLRLVLLLLRTELLRLVLLLLRTELLRGVLRLLRTELLRGVLRLLRTHHEPLRQILRQLFHLASHLQVLGGRGCQAFYEGFSDRLEPSDPQPYLIFLEEYPQGILEGCCGKPDCLDARLVPVLSRFAGHTHRF